MKRSKWKEENRPTDETLFQVMQLECTNIDTDIHSLVRQQEKLNVS